jgi:hypothetical protein
MQDPRHGGHMTSHVAARVGLPECARIVFIGHPWTTPLVASQIAVLRHFGGEIRGAGAIYPGMMSGRPMKGGSASALGGHLQVRRPFTAMGDLDSTDMHDIGTGSMHRRNEVVRTGQTRFVGRGIWWRWRDSNPRPPRCERGALPAEPHPHLAIIYFILSLRSRVLMKARRSSLTSGCCSPR